MNTENNNTLIAEFMEVEVQDEVYFILPQFPYCNQLTDYNTYDSYKKETLEYHKNWNWLMEVVEKIFKDFYKLNPCPIYLKMNIEKALIGVDKESVYNACLEFIKWYNKNK